MKSKIHIGTSGWNYDHWRGTFYPGELPTNQWLDYYSQRFQTVEVNNTFYQLPNQTTFRQWRENSPENFVYAVKANRYITHMKKLKDPEESLTNFLENVRILEHTLGPILFQLPPNWKFNEDRLASFLELLPDEFQYTFEFRDERWINQRTYQLLRENNIAFCIYELAGFLSPREVTADLVYLRLHGPGDKYQGKYDKKTLGEWADTFRRWADQGKEVYCYFDNDQLGYAAMNALELREMTE